MIITEGEIYCIHREVDTDREQDLMSSLSKLDVTVVEPEPVDIEFKPLHRFNANMNSLRETTIKLVKEARTNELPCITIIEDDCNIDEEAFDLFMEQGLPENFDFVHLSVTGTQNYGMKLTNKVFRKLYGGLGCVCYVIHNSIYDRYINMLSDNLVPIDEITRYLHLKRKNSYVVDPSPAYHVEGLYSTLKDKTVNY